jgi:segregation and condensation protein A
MPEMATVAGLPVIGTTAALDEAFAGMPVHGEGGADARAPEDAGYRINIPTFDGPLELLLHLIRRDQMNIYDIPIAQICESYLEYLTILHQPDVNVAGEFLVMASTLMQIKSAMLLPQEKADEAEDPRAPLVAQLLELERYQKAAKQIDERGWLGRDCFARPEAASKDLMPVESLMDAPIEPVESFSLLVALKVALDRSTRPPMRIEVDTTSLKDKVIEMKSNLETNALLELRSFWPERPERTEIIIAFIAMLELARLKFIEIIQPEILGPIQIRRVRDFEELNVSLLQQF